MKTKNNFSMKFKVPMILLVLFLSIQISLAADTFDVTIISEKHDLTEHEVIIQVKNLDMTNKDFNLRFIVENTNFDPSNMYDVYIYEYKPVLKEFPTYDTEFVDQTCYQFLNELDEGIPYDCSYYRNYQSGVEYKYQLDWKPTKMSLVKNLDKVSTDYGVTTIPKSESNCKYDDFNNDYDCDGIKLFKITWKTPIMRMKNGWGSKGYYSVEDAITGVNYDPWWNSNWQYRRAITITNNENFQLVNYQIEIILNATGLISQNKLRNDCGDIRFTDDNDNILSYWNETSCSDETRIWVKIPSLPALSNKTIYMYYGNPTATSTANGKATFVYFDDFDDNSFNTTSLYTSAGTWTESDGYISYSSTNTISYLTFKDPQINLNNYAVVDRVRVTGTSTFGDYRLGARLNPYTSKVNSIGFMTRIGNTGSHNCNILWVEDGAGSNSTSSASNCYPINTWHRREIRAYGNYYQAFVNRIFRISLTTSNVNQNGLPYTFYSHTNGPTMQVDYLFARNYTLNEPTYSIGSEEIGTKPPQYSNIVVSPSSPQTYGISDIWFNITWNDIDNGLDKTWISHNFSGVMQNYTMQNNTPNNFYYHLTFKPSAGTYTYTFYANDTLGEVNSTTGANYVINKAMPSLSLMVNPSWSGIYPYSVTITGSESNEGDGDVLYRLFRNGTQVNNPDSTILAAGSYNYVFSATGGQNYTSNSVSNTLTINKGTQTLKLFFNDSETKTTFYEGYINITGLTDALNNIYVYLNVNKTGWVTKSGIKRVENISNYSANVYNVTLHVLETQNYTSASLTKYLTVIIQTDIPANLVGLNFADLMTLFKTGYIEGIMGSWTLAALGLVGIALFLGVGMGLSTDLLLILTTVIGVSLVTMSLLPSILSVIIAIVAAIFIYMIYIRLFRR